MIQKNKIRLKIASKILNKYIEQGLILSNSYEDENVIKYTALSLKLADELIDKIDDKSSSNEDSVYDPEYLQNARDSVDLLLSTENDDEKQSLVLGELLNHVELTHREMYLRYLNTLILNQIMNNLTNIGSVGEDKCLNLRKIIVNKFLPIYAKNI